MTGHIAACRDIDPARLEALAGLIAEAELPRSTPVYPGSMAGQCRTCDVAVWIGPRLQHAIATLPDVWVMCFICAAQVAGPNAVSLGNPYKPKPRT